MKHDSKRIEFIANPKDARVDILDNKRNIAVKESRRYDFGSKSDQSVH